MTGAEGTPPAPAGARDSATATARRRARSTLSVLVGVVGVVALLTSVVALWARSVLFEPDAVAAALETALEDQVVTDALAVRLTDEVLLAVRAEEAVVSLLPASLEQLAPAITGGVRSYVSERLATILADDDVRAVIVTLTRQTHAALLRLIDGEGLIDGLTLVGGTVSFNALPLVARGLVIIQELGLLDGVVVPALTVDGDPQAQRAELADALGRSLPDGFGEIVIYRGEAAERLDATLDTAQRLVLLARRALAVIMVLTVAAAAGCILLAHRRGRAAVVLAAASVIVMLVARALTQTVVERVPTLAVQPGARAAVASMVATLASGLITAVTVVMIVGAVVAPVMLLLGEPRSRRVLPASLAVEVAVAAIALAGALWIIGAAGLGAGPALVSLALALLAGGSLIAGHRRDAARLRAPVQEP